MPNADLYAFQYISIRSATSRIRQAHFIPVLFRDNIDNTGDSVRAIQGRGGTFYDLDTFDIGGVDNTQVVLSAGISVDPFAIDKDQDVIVA